MIQPDHSNFGGYGPVDPPGFNTHSLKIGAAASAKQASISDSHLKFLGKWKSNAYLVGSQ